MNHKAYRDLLPKEQMELIGKCVHLLQNDYEFFRQVKKMIKLAEKEGALDDVVILPPSQELTTEKVF
jgi:hypothetical protein